MPQLSRHMQVGPVGPTRALYQVSSEQADASWASWASYPFSRLCAHHLLRGYKKDSRQKLSTKRNFFQPIIDFCFNQEPIRLLHGPIKSLVFSSHPLSTLRFKNHIQESVIVQLYRAVGDDSKLKLSHSTEKAAQLLEMLKGSKDANKTMRSIHNIITDSKRDKQIDHPKITLTLNSDK